jgi:ferric-dicitrate binding protein FerR (iron transport regulator)
MAPRGTDRDDAGRCQAAGQLVSEAMSASLRPEAGEWAQIRASLRSRRRARVLWRWALRLSLPVAVVGALAIWRWPRPSRPVLTYAADNCAVAAADGELMTRADQDGRLMFSDGSQVLLDGGSRGRVVVPNRPASAELVLDNGAADVSVVHRHDTRWAVRAGPFRVEVKGTQFHVAWSPGSRRFRLELRHGEVAISGAMFPATLVLRAGNALEVEGDEYDVRPIDQAAGAGAPRSTAADSSSLSAAGGGEPPTGSEAASEKDQHVRSKPARSVKHPLHRSALAAMAGAGLAVGAGMVTSSAVAGPPAGRGTEVLIGDDGRLAGPMTGYAWVAAGAGATISSPASCDARGCFKETHGTLCTRGSIPALACTGQGTPALSCNWAQDWGAMIGLDTTADHGPWSASAPSTVSVAYRGGRAAYRLNAHLAGDPDEKQYCVDGYQSGDVVAAGMFKSACWSDSGDALPDFQRVDKLTLQVLPNGGPQLYDLCVTAVAVNGAAGPPPHTKHVAIQPNGKLSGPMTGYAWVAGGTKTAFTVPASCGPTGCFANTDGQLCARGSIAPLACTRQGTPQLSCDWASNWGGMIGLNPGSSGVPWGNTAPAAVAISFSGPPAEYRLMAHVAGTPEKDVYCVPHYPSGQFVQAQDLTRACWSEGGAPLATFQSVDKIGLQVMSAEGIAVPIDVCIDDIATH